VPIRKFNLLINLGYQDGPFYGRAKRGDEEAMIAARGGSSDRARSIAAQSIRDQPFMI
jgi:hypothetical protein